jgi:hypothetical protein
MRAGVVLVTVAVASTAACGGTGRRSVDVVQAARRVHAAGEAGAREDPRAAYYLELAERELRRAELQARVGDDEGALGWAGRAGADAEVARLLAIEAATRGAAQRTEDQADAVSRALGRQEAR